MKTLLPILKTKLFLLSFISACTVILATTVPQIKIITAPENAISEKITMEHKKISHKIKKQNKTVSASRVTSSVALVMHNSFEATVQTNVDDHAPAEYVGDTGSVNESKVICKGLGKTIANGVEQSGRAFIMAVIDGKNATAPGTDLTIRNALMEVSPEFTFDVKAFPNQSGDQFSLYLEGANNERVSISVYDALGREVKKFEKDSGNIPIRFGKDLKGGIYFVEVRQDTNRKIIKLVKQN